MMVGFLGLGTWSELEFEPYLFLESNEGWVLGFWVEDGGWRSEEGGWSFLLVGSLCIGWLGLACFPYFI